MKFIQITIIFLIGLFLTNCSNTNKYKILKYKILKNDIYDAPIKTQVELNVLITDKVTMITKKNVSNLLTILFNQTKERQGFKYHTYPTNIYIYAYASEEKANSGMAQWVGMVSKSTSDLKPQITISDKQIDSLTLKLLKNDSLSGKSSLSEDIRLQIWTNIIKIEDKATKVADKRYPLNHPGLTHSEINKNSDLNKKLKKRFMKKLAIKYSVSAAVLDSIVFEGLKKGWAFP